MNPGARPKVIDIRRRSSVSHSRVFHLSRAIAPIDQDLIHQNR